MVNVTAKNPKKPKEDINVLVRQLSTLKRELKDLKAQEKKLVESISKYIDSSCKADERGNRYYTTSDDDTNSLIVKREARKSYNINEEKAKDYLSKDPIIYDRVFTTIEVEKFDGAELENLVAEKLLTIEDVQCFTDEKVTYATVFVKSKEDSNEEEGE